MDRRRHIPWLLVAMADDACRRLRGRTGGGRESLGRLAFDRPVAGSVGEPDRHRHAEALAHRAASATASNAPPTPVPETELEALLPNFIGTDYTTKHAFTLDEIRADGVGGGPSRALINVFDALGARPELLEAAEAHASRFGIVALRIGGVDPVALADATVDAIAADEAGSSVSSRKVDGRDVRRIGRPAGLAPS